MRQYLLIQTMNYPNQFSLHRKMEPN